MSLFGRKENYDEYNEKYNAKYDDDYIREEKEYRAECDHSHGQTYEENEYRSECGHDHGQTYEDFNSEQQSYDELSELEKKFADKLGSDEYIMWCGKAEKDAKFSENGLGCIGCFGVGFLAFALLIFIFSPVVSICIIVSMIYILRGTDVKNRNYAITNKRFIVLNRGKLSSVPIGSIGSVTYRSSPRNIGSVFFMVNSSVNSGKTKGYFYNGIFAVKDPKRVCEIMKAAIAGNINF